MNGSVLRLDTWFSECGDLSPLSTGDLSPSQSSRASLRSEPLDAALSDRQVGQAGKAATSRRTPNGSPPGGAS